MLLGITYLVSVESCLLANLLLLVAIPVALLAEHLATGLTTVRLCAGVRAHVIHDVALLFKDLVAEVTSEDLVVSTCLLTHLESPCVQCSATF